MCWPQQALRILFCTLLLWPGLAGAENWPTRADPFLNDFAGAVLDEAKPRIRRSLEALQDETGAQVVILTLDSLAANPADGAAALGRELHDRWSLGPRGVLVLVLEESRGVHIELGVAFDDAARAEAGAIIDTVFAPALRLNAFTVAIETGTNALISRVIRPGFAASETAPEAPGMPTWLLWGSGAVAAVLALLIWRFAWPRLRRCPQCRSRGSLAVTRRVTRKPRRGRKGKGEKRTRCDTCGYDAIVFYTVWQNAGFAETGGDAGGFGGGSSEGGGASGDW
jgi:uncharacterized protein